ncbi:MAG: hypothetical protein EXR77_04960 [Myxococcales bacterium]|nr:hypothetical protein [Myxococcales bacterium]
MTRELISEFEARRVERMVNGWWLGLLRNDETLRVLGGDLQAGWLAVRWELANTTRTWVYRVEVRADLKVQDLRERQAIDLIYDFLGAQFDDFLRQGREQFTGPDWEQVDFADKQLFTRGQIESEAAEAAGTRLLHQPAITESSDDN